VIRAPSWPNRLRHPPKLSADVTYSIVSRMWSTRVRVSGGRLAVIAARNRWANSRTLMLVSCERQTRMSNALSAMMP
jgi:hypothetical protein